MTDLAVLYCGTVVSLMSNVDIMVFDTLHLLREIKHCLLYRTKIGDLLY